MKRRFIFSSWGIWLIWLFLFMFGSIVATYSRLLPIYGQTKLYVAQIILECVVIIGFWIVSLYTKINFQFNFERIFSNNLFAWLLLFFYFLVAFSSLLKVSFSLLILITSLFISIAEELVFRGQILISAIKNCNSHYNILYGIIISSFLFGISHVVNIFNQSLKATLIQIISGFSLGLILGILYLTSMNLLIPITLHFFIDFSAFNFSNTMTNQNTSLFSAITLLIVASFICLIQLRPSRINEIQSKIKSL